MAREPSISVAGLGDVAETLLIPLAARALAPTLNPDLCFRDPIAEDTLARLDTAPERFIGDRASMRGSIVRTLWFDRTAAAFLRDHPGGLCVSLGAGLDRRADRIGIERFPEAAWVDLDVEPVIAIRQQVFGVAGKAVDMAADLIAPNWPAALPWPAARPAFFLAEGVLMYLQPSNAEALFRQLARASDARHAPIHLAFDYASPWMVRNSARHPSVRKTKARFHWALARPADLASIDPRLTLVEQADITASSGRVPALMGMVHRLLTGREIYACAHLSRDPAA